MNDADTFSKVDLQEKVITIIEKKIKLSCFFVQFSYCIYEVQKLMMEK